MSIDISVPPCNVGGMVTRNRRRSSRNPDTISAAQAENIRACEQASEKARELFDPKRFKRGGGYTPAEMREIERIAGCKAPTNEERSALEVYDFVHSPPDKYFLYVDDKTGKAITFMGDVLGSVERGRSYKSPAFGSTSTRVPIKVYGINGVIYSGTYFSSAGSYARVKRVKGRVRR